MNSVPSLPRPCAARGCIAVVMALACALGRWFQSYVAKPLDREGAGEGFLRRGPEDPELRSFMSGRLAPGESWPPTEWTLRELTLLAIFYRPDVPLAQAQARASRAAVITAGQRPNP